MLYHNKFVEVLTVTSMSLILLSLLWLVLSV